LNKPSSFGVRVSTEGVNKRKSRRAKTGITALDRPISNRGSVFRGGLSAPEEEEKRKGYTPKKERFRKEEKGSTTRAELNFLDESSETTRENDEGEEEEHG